MEDHWHKLEKAAVQEWSLRIAFAIISDLNVLFPICQITSEPGQI